MPISKEEAEKLINGTIGDRPDMREELVLWLQNAPDWGIEGFKRCPAGIYLVNDGAPYAFTGPGTIGLVIAWHKDGYVSLKTNARGLRPAVQREDGMVLTGLGEWVKLPPGYVVTEVDPIWLSPIDYSDEWVLDPPIEA